MAGLAHGLLSPWFAQLMTGLTHGRHPIAVPVYDRPRVLPSQPTAVKTLVRPSTLAVPDHIQHSTSHGHPSQWPAQPMSSTDHGLTVQSHGQPRQAHGQPIPLPAKTMASPAQPMARKWQAQPIATPDQSMSSPAHGRPTPGDG